jgi:phosphohistidine phosphatase
MKTLYIVRHAKASRDEIHLKDWERSLIPEGIERANEVSKILKGKKVHPGKIISSHAFRALNTALIFARCLEYPLNEIEVSQDLYETNKQHILRLLKKQENRISSLMIFGHNPVFTDLYNLLTGEQLEDFPTSAVACIQFETDQWVEIGEKKGKCLFLEAGE